MLGDQELFPLIVRLQDLEHDTRGLVFYLEEAKNYQPPDQLGLHRTGAGRRRPVRGTSSGSGARLKKSLASIRNQKLGLRSTKRATGETELAANKISACETFWGGCVSSRLEQC